jgi:hypothetical protein
MSFSLKKINPACSNIQLIDINECIGDSLSAINSNIDNFSKSLDGIYNSLANWTYGDVLSNFYTNSGLMISTMLDVQTINDVYISPYTTIQNLSAQWNSKQFSVYYPEIIRIDYYNSNLSTYSGIIYNWFIQNFPNKNFVENQIINIFITLNYISLFGFRFRSDLQETCTPTKHTGESVIKCNGCGEDNRFGGCNHDAGHRHWCDNAYSYCGKTTYTADTQSYQCQGHTKQTYECVIDSGLTYNVGHYGLVFVGNTGYLSIDYLWRNLEDEFVCRVLKYTLKNQYDEYAEPLRNKTKRRKINVKTKSKANRRY